MSISEIKEENSRGESSNVSEDEANRMHPERKKLIKIIEKLYKSEKLVIGFFNTKKYSDLVVPIIENKREDSFVIWIKFIKHYMVLHCTKWFSAIWHY